MTGQRREEQEMMKLSGCDHQSCALIDTPALELMTEDFSVRGDSCGTEGFDVCAWSWATLQWFVSFCSQNIFEVIHHFLLKLVISPWWWPFLWMDYPWLSRWPLGRLKKSNIVAVSNVDPMHWFAKTHFTKSNWGLPLILPMAFLQ